MLDALVTEARLRFGLDPADGLQVVAAERLVATPDRAVAAGPHRARWRCSVRPARPTTATGRVRAAARSARTARARPAGRPRPAVPRRTIRSAGSGAVDRTTVGALTAGDLAAPALPRADRAGGGRRRAVGDACHQRSPARPGRLPVGSRADPRRACASTCSRRPTRSTTPSRPGRRPDLAGELGDLLLQVVLHAQLAAEAGVFDLADVQAGDRDQDRPPPSARVRRGRGADGVGRQPPVGADQGRRSAPSRDAEARTPDGAAAGRARRHLAVAAGARRQPGDAGAGRQPRLRLAVDRRASSTRSSRRPTSCARPAHGGDAAGWAEEFGDLLFVLVNVARKRGVEAEAAHARGERQVPAPVRQRRAPGRRRAASPCATSTSRRSTRCGTPPRRRRGPAT